MKVKPLNLILGLALAAFLAKNGLELWQERDRLDLDLKTPQLDAAKFDTKAKLQRPLAETHPSVFACDGRTACGQMTSCEEAKFFLSKCPNTQKMDSDSNGIPCEKVVCD